MSLHSTAERRLPPWWLEASVALAGYGTYQLVQVLVTGAARPAVARADRLWAIESQLHLDPELALNHLLAAHHTLVVLAGLYYGALHFVLTPTMLVWLRLRRRGSYVSLRNTLVWTSLAALVMYWWLPLAPPRLAVAGVIDTSKVNNILSAGSPSWPASLANQYAAMPSLHVAWAVWVALACEVAFAGSSLRHLAWVYPILTTLVVIATGNHLLADAVVAGALVGAVWLVCDRRAAADPRNCLSPARERVAEDRRA